MDLLDVLRQEKELLIGMLNLLKEEKEVLIKDDIKELDRITKIKEELKLKIDDIENTRFDMCRGKKLKDILPQLNMGEREEAQKIGEEMENITFGIQEINNTNRMLINQSLNYIRTIINIISPNKPSVYGATGKIEGSRINNSLLNKSV